jgi:hypothetical protein
MSRNHFKRKKKKAIAPNISTEKLIVKEDKPAPRGETIKPARNGGYTHSFNYYEVVIPAKGEAKCNG